jgi:UrcA family protein
MLNRYKIVTLLGVAVAITLLSGVANADSLRSVSVKSADLDLTSDAGRAALQDRVRGAVNEVCVMRDWGSGLDAQKATDACRQKVLAQVTAQVDAKVKAAQSRQFANRNIAVSAH